MNALSRSCVAELVATFTLTFVGAGTIITTGGQNLVAIALAHGLALSVAVYASGHISGGHVNPAVTVAMFATKRMKGSEAIAYIVSQLVGASIAAWLLALLFTTVPIEGIDVAKVKLGATLGGLSNTDGQYKVLILEAFLTFLLVTTIFGVAVDKRGPKNVYGFAIGLTVALDILFAGGITGASMNPARSFGPALVGGHWDIHWAYWAGPVLGAVVAAYLYDAVQKPKQADGGGAAG